MDTQKLINHWKAGAEDARVTMNALFEKERYHHALFFGHLMLEKILKALVVQETGEHAPPIHDLNVLADKSGLSLSEENVTFLKDVTDFNLEARYPEEIEKMRKQFTPEFSKEYCQRIQEFYTWIHSKLQQ